MYELFFTKKFSKAYANLPKNLQSRVDKQLSFLVKDLYHPSLNTKRMAGTNMWEARATKDYRFSLQKLGNNIILYTVGPHDVGLGKK